MIVTSAGSKHFLLLFWTRKHFFYIWKERVERTRGGDGERREGERWKSDGSTLPYVAWKEGKKMIFSFFLVRRERKNDQENKDIPLCQNLKGLS